MATWDIGMSHIVDVDGQLFAIDADAIDAATLLVRANCSPDCQLSLVRAGERFALKPRGLIRLYRDEVLFFETSAAFAYGTPERLAA